MTITTVSLFVAFAAYSLPIPHERLRMLFRVFGHLAVTTLLVVVILELSRPVQRSLDEAPAMGTCFERSRLTPSPGRGLGEKAGLYTRLFKCGVEVTRMPWLVWLIGCAALYLVATAITYELHKPRRTTRGIDSILTLLATLFSAVAIPLATYFLLATLNVNVLRALGTDAFWSAGTFALIFGIPWLGILAAGFIVRGFLITYVGDVAAYVASHKLDRFAEVRAKIKETVDGVFRTVYLLKEGGVPVYRQVAVVGHSLGSVVSFDAINAVLLGEQLQPADDLRVKERTTLFLTFGSPLDKIAYVYSTISTATAATREMLVGAAKPLLSDRSTRKDLFWLNVWSPADIISGPLEFYDDPQHPALDRVVNVPDPYATTPLAAHTEYYEHDLIFLILEEWHLF